MPIIDLHIVLYLMDIMEIRTYRFYFIFVCQNNNDSRISFSTAFAIGDYRIDPKSDIICEAKEGSSINTGDTLDSVSLLGVIMSLICSDDSLLSSFVDHVYCIKCVVVRLLR